MSGLPAPALAPIPTGNSFDKYGSENPLIRRLVRGFQDALDELIDQANPGSILDVGCGEGVLSERWAQRLANTRVVGLDLDDAGLHAHWAGRAQPNLEFVTGRAQRLPFASQEFDLVAAIESLEHVAQPRRVLEEMARVARGHLLVSVPREPAWRALNLARGAYPRALGNTPGHVNHWSKRALLDLVCDYGPVVTVRSPLPWTMALVRMS
jgi:2-polyprenyl-3-methyl-5-hydroxy-6-metoxy-1,4-benzoquinol methylase